MAFEGYVNENDIKIFVVENLQSCSKQGFRPRIIGLKIFRYFLKPVEKNAPSNWKFSAEYFKRIANASSKNCDQGIKLYVNKLEGQRSGPPPLLFEKWLDSKILEKYLRWGTQNLKNVISSST